MECSRHAPGLNSVQNSTNAGVADFGATAFIEVFGLAQAPALLNMARLSVNRQVRSLTGYGSGSADTAPKRTCASSVYNPMAPVRYGLTLSTNVPRSCPSPTT